MEKSTKRLDMCLQQSIATGMLSVIMPTKVGNEMPRSEVILSSKMARPVNPLESRSAGRMKTINVKACKKAETITEQPVMTRRTPA